MASISTSMDQSNKNSINNNHNNIQNNKQQSLPLNSSKEMDKLLVENGTMSVKFSHQETNINNSTTTTAVALTASGKPKEKRRNNEKRKERSRDAARCRRSRETEIFTELAQGLPLKKEDVQQLDKASIMRIAISYLKVRDMFKMFPKIQELVGDLQLAIDKSLESSENSNSSAETVGNSNDSNDSFTQASPVIAADENEKSSGLNTTAVGTENVEDFGLLLKQTLDGFLLILSNDGDITYVTGNISQYLGLSKIDIMGQQIWEYAHQCDHADLKEALNIKRNGLTEKVKDEKLCGDDITTYHRDLFVRLKCTITSRGRSINIKSASYKVIHITGHLVVNAKGDRVLVAIGRPIPHPSNIEVPLGNTTFLTKHSLDMKFTYVDDKMFNLLGYKPEDLLETSFYNCHHGNDSDSLMKTFKNVLSKGQGETCRYRFLGKYGGYCWVITQATVVYDKLKPQSVVCVNFVISNLEKNNEIYTLQQYEESQKLKTEVNTELLNKNNNKSEKVIVKDQLNEAKKIYAATELKKPLEPATAKVERTTIPPATPATSASLHNINNKNNLLQINNSKNINEDQKNHKNSVSIKIEQIPPPTTITASNNNINTNKNNLTAVATTPNTSSLINIPPQQLPVAVHCPTTTVTHTIFNKNTNGPLKVLTDDKRPKTVTSSLILTNLPTTTSTQSILQQQPQQSLNVAKRAPQSVTASVFSPLPGPPKLPSTTATAAILAQHSPTQTKPQQEKSANHQQDMNKDYLSFAEDATELTMLKEEPDDLTAHLVATNAVDACMPLDESGPLFGEILVGLGMGSYGSLLPDDINSLDSNTSCAEPSNNISNNHITLKSPSNNTSTCSSALTSPTSPSSTSYNAATMTTTSSHSLRQSSPSLITTTTTTACATNNNNNNTITATTAITANSTNIDPFINYRDESNDTNCSQHLLSPSVTSKSPEGSSLPSLCSPNSLSQEEEFSYYTMNVDDMDDLTMRAPYIPMDEQDDLPLLTSEDYMWSSGNAFTPDEFSLHTKDSDNLQALQINQSLNYQQQQFTQQQTQQFSNSLCSSPASTVSSMPSSPLEQQQNSAQIFTTDSSELAALLCGSTHTSFTVLQESTNFSNSLNLNGSDTTASLVGGSGSGGLNVNGCRNQNNSNNNNSNIVGTGDNGVVGLTGDLNNSTSNALDHHQQLQQHCLQQFQEQLQQQHQELLSGLNINCKKEKFDVTNNSTSLTSNLCDTMEDTFDTVYSKNSNLDCWNEFLQINANENADTTNIINNGATTTITQQHGMEDCKQQLQMQLQQEEQQQQQQQQQTQNIIINAVPLITIQTNKNVLIPTANNQRQQQQQQQLSSQNQQSNTKSTLNKVTTIKLAPITSTAAIKIIDNKQQQQQQQQQQQNIIKTAFIQATAATALQSNNKRHLSNTQIATNTLESKRLKSHIVDLKNSTTTPQLLHQLITSQQQQQQQQGNINKKTCKGYSETRWSTNENQAQQQQQQQQQLLKQQQQQHKQSNSVLKNLLISGCDKTNLIKSETITADDASRSSMQSPDVCHAPLQCVTSSAALLRNYRHNPWIGAPGLLPSPTTSLITNEDSNPPGLTPCDGIDSASDSGIDDMNPTENMSPLKRPFELEKHQIENVFGMKAAPAVVNKNFNINKNNNNDKENSKTQGPLEETTTEPEINLKLISELNTSIEEEEDGASLCKRKRSMSYMCGTNPLMTPFLMDLCNDDYHMNTKEYLQENDIENVLSEWPVDLV